MRRYWYTFLLFPGATDSHCPVPYVAGGRSHRSPLRPRAPCASRGCSSASEKGPDRYNSSKSSFPLCIRWSENEIRYPSLVSSSFELVQLTGDDAIQRVIPHPVLFQIDVQTSIAIPDPYDLDMLMPMGHLMFFVLVFAKPLQSLYLQGDVFFLAFCFGSS